MREPYIDSVLQSVVTDERLVVIGRGLLTSYALGTGKRASGFGYGEDRYACAAAPTLVGDLAIVLANGDDDGECNTVRAFDVTTGSETWHTALAAGDLAELGQDDPPMLVAAGQQVFAGVNDRVYALDAGGGRLAWNVVVGAGCPIDAARAATGTLLLDSFCGDQGSSRTLTALGAADGKVRWRSTYAQQAKPGPRSVSIVATDPPAVTATQADLSVRLYRFGDTGGQPMSVLVGADPGGQAVVGDLLLVHLDDEKLAAFDLGTGKQAWTTSLRSHSSEVTFVQNGGRGTTAVIAYRPPGGGKHRLANVRTADGDITDDRPLPDGAIAPGAATFYWQAGSTLLGMQWGSVRRPDDGPWLAAMKPTD